MKTHWIELEKFALQLSIGEKMVVVHINKNVYV